MMRRSWFWWIASVTVAVASMSMGVAHTQSRPTLPEPWRRMTLTDTFTRSRAFPLFSRGYAISFPRVLTEPADIVVVSLTTGERQAVRFGGKFASEIRIDSIAVTRDKHLLVAGSYDRAAGAAPINFATALDFTGRRLATWDLGAYTPERICGAADGTFWTVGQIWSDEDKSVDGSHAQGGYGILRHYASDGTLKQSFFDRSVLPTQARVNFHPLGSHYGFDVTPAYLSCGDDSVGLYIGYGRTPYWFEVDSKTGSAKRWAIEDVPFSRITGLALFSSGTVYASFGFQKTPSNKVLVGLYRLVLRRDGSAVWDRVMTHGFAMLLGSDGQNLIHRRRGVNEKDASAVYWSGLPAVTAAQPN